MNKSNIIKKIVNVYTLAGFFCLFVALAFVMTPVVPYIAYRLNPEETTNEINIISQTIAGESDNSSSTTSKYLPPLDLTLPKEPYISITKIKVYSPISIDSDYTKALKSGTWLVPDYGTPENGLVPIIIAAHRFGYINWDDNTRQKISFYNLPKTDIGDKIEIIWNQRKYTYEIYGKAEGSKIIDYSSDLILYTCKYFNSPIRIFRYAKLVTP
jgi:sortase (surface protein transpeptidase)